MLLSLGTASSDHPIEGARLIVSTEATLIYCTRKSGVI
jgi:hypothetical protein